MPQLYFNSRRQADLPLHYGRVPTWLAERMSALGGAITESIVHHYGRQEFLSRLSDPFWFQAFGCVLGMDWHSSGITTSVMGSLKYAINRRSNELGLYVCGGKGKSSRQTPAELFKLADKTGLDGNKLAYCSRLTAKVDNNVIQDGFQLYMHSFVVSKEGEWAVVQQGMNENTGMARRYHWHSENIKSFVENPHTSIYGLNQGIILNLADLQAKDTKEAIVDFTKENPVHLMSEIVKLKMPEHHDLQRSDVNLKRLGAVLTLSHEREVTNFEDILMLEGVGPRTIQSLALVSEIIHGTPSRFEDPGRFSFAHGGKDGHPFPVPLKIYDETIHILHDSVEKAKIGNKEKSAAIKNLSFVSKMLEENFEPDSDLLEKAIKRERKDSWKYGGRTIYGDAKKDDSDGQLSLF